MIQAIEPLTPKELLVFVPAAGSAIALTWEVGSFAPIGSGAFMLFSLSEHLQFATQALPLALVAASSIALSFILFRPLNRSVDRRLDERLTAIETKIDHADVKGARSELSTLRRVLRIATATLFLLGVLGTSYGYFHAHSASVTLMGCVMIALSAAVLFLKPGEVSRFAIIFAGGIVVLCMSMAVGIDITRSELNSAARPATVQLQDAKAEYVLVRSGDRGLLLYDRRSQAFMFKKWDDVRDLNWKRTSLIR